MPGSLTRETVAAYVVGQGLFDRPEGREVAELTGGISSTVLAVRGEGKRIVVKQALPQFRVADEWLVPQERVLAEAQALEVMAELVGRLTDLPGVRVWNGQLRFRDRARRGMTTGLFPLRVGQGNAIGFASSELLISAAIAVSR